jgi:hypothetical protein
MNSFDQINRLMGTRREMAFQAKNGAFDDRLGLLMNRADPYWQDREKTEMDIYERQSPVGVGPMGEEKTVHTSREKSETTITASELLSKDQAELAPLE